MTCDQVLQLLTLAAFPLAFLPLSAPQLKFRFDYCHGCGSEMIRARQHAAYREQTLDIGVTLGCIWALDVTWCHVIDRRIDWTPYLVIIERFQAIYGGQQITWQVVGITAGWLTVEAGRRVVAVRVIWRVRPLLLLMDFVVFPFRCIVYKISDVNKCT